MFSIGLRYGLIPGHSSTEILFFYRNSMATIDWRRGAPSCMNIVQPRTCRCSFSFSLSNPTYLGPSMGVLGGMKYRPAAPRHDMAPQIIWSQHISCQSAYPMATKCACGDIQTSAWYIHQKSTLFSTLAMTSGKVQSLFFHYWCYAWLSCRPVGL